MRVAPLLLVTSGGGLLDAGARVSHLTFLATIAIPH
jgi:hypothetical protein